MFTKRSRTSDNIRQRQRGRGVFELSSPGNDVPLTTVNWSMRWCTLPMEREEHYKEIYEFEVKEDDIYVVTFPKCGTTWMQEAVWLLANNLDYQTAHSVDLATRSVFMDMSSMYAALPVNTVEMAKNACEPRILKTHFPPHLIPVQIWQKKTKIVYCARNPKDTVVSYYHFHRGLGSWQGTIDEYVEDFINNDVMYCPYWDHIMDYWQLRSEPNVFFTTFEDMKRDLKNVLTRLNRFLEKPELSAEEVNKLEEHLSFESMKANKHANPTVRIKATHASPHITEDFQFMRRGTVGQYKEELSEETQKKLDQWIEENLLKYNIKLSDIFGEF